MFTWLSSVFTPSLEGDVQEVVTRFVAKTTGQRGPLIALIPAQHNTQALAHICVTPCSVFVFFWDQTAASGKRMSLQGDAFTCACAVGRQTQGTVILAGTQNGQVIRISLDDNFTFVSRVVTISDSPVIAIAVSEDATKCAAGFGNGVVVFWSTSEQDELDKRKYLRDPSKQAAVVSLVFVQSAGTLWTGYSDGSVVVFSLEEGGNFQTIPNICVGIPAVMKWHKKLDVVLISDSHKELVVVSVSDHSVPHRYDAGLVTCGSPLTCMEILKDRNELVCLGADDGSFCIRELSKSDKDPQRLKFHLLKMWEVAASDAGPVTCVAVDVVANALVVGDAGCRVRSVNIQGRSSF